MSGGNLVLFTYNKIVYSDDNGSTWNDSTGAPSYDYSNYLRTWGIGNEIWLLHYVSDGVLAVYRSIDGGVTFAQYGNNLDVTGEAGFASADSGVIIANVGTITTCLVILRFQTATEYHLHGYLWNTGTSSWDASGDLSSGTTGFYRPIDTIIWNTDDSKAYFLRDYNSGANRCAQLLCWSAGIITIIHSFNNYSGTKNLHVDSQTNLIYYNGFFVFSGDLYDGINHDSYLTTRNLLSGIYTTWESRALQQFFIFKTDYYPRTWACDYLSLTPHLYLSHNSGATFVPIIYKTYDINGIIISTPCTFTSGIDLSNSDRGVAIISLEFIGGVFYIKFYTFQEATWEDWFSEGEEGELALGIRSNVNHFVTYVNPDVVANFPEGYVLCLYDDAGNALFQGKLSNKRQTGNEYLLTFDGVEKELQKAASVTQFAAKTVEEIAETLIDAEGTIVWQSASITSPATTYTLDVTGSKSVAQILDEIERWCGDYCWRVGGDAKITMDDGTTASALTIDANTDIMVPTNQSQGAQRANRIIVYGRIESNGPVNYIAEDIPDQTTNGIITYRIHQPTWDYNQCKAYADQLLLDRVSWTDILQIAIAEDLTLRPGTTVAISSLPAELGISDGTYLLCHVRHKTGMSYLVLNNTALTMEDWSKEQEYIRNAIGENYTDAANTPESSGSSTTVAMEGEENVLSGIWYKRTTEANAFTLIYDSTHKLLLWVDSSGNGHFKFTADFILKNGSKIQVNSAGDDKNVKLYHDDTDGILVSSAGKLKIGGATTVELTSDLSLGGKNIDFPTTPNISDCLDEDNMASNSATKLCTQQSIKAYADTKTTLTAVKADADIADAITKKHVAVTVSAPISLSGQALSLVNSAAGTVTAISTDGTLADNSDVKVATQKALKTYADTKVAKSTLTEQGDIFYASAASTPAALAHGTSGQFLKTQGHGANPTWADVAAVTGTRGTVPFVPKFYECTNSTIQYGMEVYFVDNDTDVGTYHLILPYDLKTGGKVTIYARYYNTPGASGRTLIFRYVELYRWPAAGASAVNSWNGEIGDTFTLTTANAAGTYETGAILTDSTAFTAGDEISIHIHRYASGDTFAAAAYIGFFIQYERTL